MNKQAAIEWLRIAYHDLKSAQILFDADHYTDSIGCDLQQAIEKRYPNPNYLLPEKDEIKEVLRFAETFLVRICNALSIDSNEIDD